MHTHRLIALLLAGILYAAATPSQATNKPPVQPPAAPGAKAHADANAAAAANSSATAGDSSATGGSVGGDTSNSRFLAIALPAPAFVAPLPLLPETTCVDAGGSAESIGWNFASRGSNRANPDKCIAIGLYNAAVSSCRYATAGQIMDLLTAEVLKGFQPPKRAELFDLTPNECAMLKTPVPPAKAELLIPPEPPKAKPRRHVAPAPKSDGKCGNKSAKTGFLMTGCV